MEICCKLVVSMWFPLCFPLREIAFFTQCWVRVSTVYVVNKDPAISSLRKKNLHYKGFSSRSVSENLKNNQQSSSYSPVSSFCHQIKKLPDKLPPKPV